ncbi:GvpL/GvpF family gas vesicle protein [Pimelobacter simplex]|uniref:GvpL/GvpF family gas vesicle protein n=1 Tax=Nocardioides simplex TaxID=2045 RepID=UPI00367214D0
MPARAPSRTSAPTETGETGETGALIVFGVVPAAGASGVEMPDDLRVTFVVSADLAAAVAPAPPSYVRPGRAELLHHHGVLDALAARGATVPVRFGTIAPDRAGVVDFLSEQHDRLAATLDALTGRRQFNLRATYVEDAVLADLVVSDPEIRALRERTRDVSEDASYPDRIRLGELVAQGLAARGARDADVLLGSVEPLVADLRVRSEPAGTQLLDVALLVDDARTQHLLDSLEGLAEENHEQIRLRLVGPMAAYDFAGDPPWA